MNPEIVHERLRALAKKRAGMDYEIGRWLLAGKRLSLHERLGFTSYPAYVERVFDFDRRMARERVRVAEGLESLPRLAEALREGTRSWSAVRELSRVATPEKEAEWLAFSAGKSVHEIERAVAGRVEGDGPTDRPRPEGKKRLALEMSAETWALFQEAKTKLVHDAGHHVDDDGVVAALARAVLNGASAGEDAGDDGAASYQTVLTTCESCRVTTMRAGADQVVVGEATLERAQCDALDVGRVDVDDPPRATQTIPPKTKRALLHRHGGACAVAGCGHAAFVEVHHIDRRADGGTHDPDQLIVLCSAHHTAVHEGKLVIRGRYSSGFAFEHADAVRYGSPEVAPERAFALATVLQLLVTMGFKHRQAQAMLDAVKATHAGHVVEDLLKAALRAAPLPRGRCVREDIPTYERIVA